MTIEQETKYLKTLLPLGPEDFPPGTALRNDTWKGNKFKQYWHSIMTVDDKQVWLNGDISIDYMALRLWEKSTDNGKTWTLCHK